MFSCGVENLKLILNISAKTPPYENQKGFAKLISKNLMTQLRKDCTMHIQEYINPNKD